MKKSLSIIMIAIIGLIIIYATVCLFMGNFMAAYATLPFLVVYYVGVGALKRRKSREQPEDNDPGAIRPEAPQTSPKDSKLPR